MFKSPILYKYTVHFCRYLGVTQFEPCDARTAFPCYDEPSIKTTYNIKIACGLDYNAKANSPALGVQILCVTSFNK